MGRELFFFFFFNQEGILLIHSKSGNRGKGGGGVNLKDVVLLPIPPHTRLKAKEALVNNRVSISCGLKPRLVFSLGIIQSMVLTGDS